MGNMGFDSVKIIFISKELELVTPKKSLPFLVVSPHIFLVLRIALTTRRLRKLYRQHSLSLGYGAIPGEDAKPTSVNPKSAWVGSDFTVARRFELLANHWVENTIGIVFKFVCSW